jgi:hypothetical protein
MEVRNERKYQKLAALFQFSGLKKAFPEIPPVLPFSKGGELFHLGLINDRNGSICISEMKNGYWFSK